MSELGQQRLGICAVLALATLACAACSGGPALPSLSGTSLVDVSAISVASIGGEPSRIAQPSAEVYARIARGANRCWFGPAGRLSTTHLMHADVAPSASGGAVDLVVHERAVDQPKPWGYKAFRVVLTESAGLDGAPGAGGTEIAVENTRIPDAEGKRMRAEAFQWAAGTEGCKADPALDKDRIAAAPVAAAAPAKIVAKARPRRTTTKAPVATGSVAQAK